MKRKFLRRDVSRHPKFGKGRGKKAKWRKPSGRHNKMREKKRGYPSLVEIGGRTAKKTRGKYDGKIPIVVLNVKDLENISKNEIGIVGGVGKKKKLEIAKKAKEMKIKLKNLNSLNFLKKNEKKAQKKQEENKEEKK